MAEEGETRELIAMQLHGKISEKGSKKYLQIIKYFITLLNRLSDYYSIRQA